MLFHSTSAIQTIAPSIGIDPNWSVIEVRGPQATDFLQGQTTCDVAKLGESESCLGAHCNPKGRIVANFILVRQTSEHYLLVLKYTAADILSNSLAKYAAFSKVDIERHSNYHLVTKAENDVINSEDIALTPYLSLSTAEISTQSECANHLFLSCAMAFTDDATSELFLPHEINLVALGGVSFTKGCYTGQEIIARMKYLGKLKKAAYLYSGQFDKLVPGEKIATLSGEKATVIDSYNNQQGSVSLLLIEHALKDTTLIFEQGSATPILMPYDIETEAS